MGYNEDSSKRKIYIANYLYKKSKSSQINNLMVYMKTFGKQHLKTVDWKR